MNTLLSLVRSLAGDLVDLVAPVTCAACGEAFPARFPLCEVCSHHLAPPDEAPEGVFVAYDHGGPLARAIHRAKYGDDPAVAAALGVLLADAWEAHEEGEFDVVVPVPLHAARLRSRGFNQSAELSRALAQRLGAVVGFDAAWRVRDTPTQTKLDREARRANVRDAFLASASLRGKRVLLVDDVVTTGSTLDALRDACEEAGAVTVRATALARAPLFFSAQ